MGKSDGSTTQALAGSGTSSPGGVETLIEYDGLIMNDRANIDRYLIREIDGLEDAEVRDTREVYPDEHGEQALKSLYSGRTIILNGRIEAYNLRKLRDMFEELKSAFADISEEKPLYFRYKTGHNNLGQSVYIDCKKSAMLEGNESQTTENFFRDFQISVRASNPRFKSLDENEVTVPITLVANTSFENGVSEYETQDGGTYSVIQQTIDSAYATKGTTVLRWKVNNNATPRSLFLREKASEVKLVNVGDEFYITADVSGNVTANASSVILGYVDQTGAFLETGMTNVNNGRAKTTNDNKRKLEAIITVPSGVTSIRPAFKIDTAVASADFSVYVDDLNLVKSDVPVTPNEVEINNLGNFPAKVSVEATGPLTIFTLNESVSDLSLVTRSGIDSGDTITFDSENLTVKDQDGNLLYTLLHIDSEWINIASARKGTSTFSFTGSGKSTDSEVKIRYNDTWI